MSSEEKLIKKKRSYYYLLVFSVFSVACFAAAMSLERTVEGVSIYKEQLGAFGGELGPFEVARDNTVYRIEVNGELQLGAKNSTWGFIEGSLLDADRKFLIGFGDEMWKERDSEGTYESTSMVLDLMIARKGVYYFKFQPEYPDLNSAGGPISIKITPLRGNPNVPFTLGLLSFLIVFFGRIKLYFTPGAELSGKKNDVNIYEIYFWMIAFALFLFFIIGSC